ncbi:MAG: polysaccharide biosynthesis tyrosine autokinase [Phycisphaerae bacterium]|nr:polysaccharide biosynthesis tyrosine autokinase [Phycisphaerae bacterium]
MVPGSEVYEGGEHQPLSDSIVIRNLGILRRHMWLTLAVFVVIATIGLIRAYRAQPVYESVAKIMIERQGPRFTKFEDVVESSVPWWGKDYYRTQEELVRSRAVLDVALEEPGVAAIVGGGGTGDDGKRSVSASWRQSIAALLGIPPSSPAEPWERLRGMVSGAHVRDSHFLLIRARSGNAERSALLANAVAQSFVRYHMRRRLEISNDVFLYLQDQKEREEAALREAERTLQEYREQIDMSSLNAGDSDHPVLKRLALLNEQLTGTEMDRISVESEFWVVKQALGGEKVELQDEQLFSLPSVREDGTVSEVRKALVAAQGEYADLSETYGEQHPRLQAAASRVTWLQGRLRDAFNEIIGSLGARLKMLSEKERKLREEYVRQKEEAIDLAKQALAFQHLQNEVTRHQKLFEMLIQRMSEVELTADYTRTNVEVIETAGKPKAPAGPNKRRMAATSLVFALIAGVGLAFVLERVDDTVRTPEDLERRVGISVLGFVPEIRVRKGVESRTAYRALVCAAEPTSSAIEAYRNIRTALFFSLPAEEARVLVISSAGPGDGKTTTATNLALIIAQSGKRVLLIDADFRRPMVHRIYGLNGDVGLSSVLVGEVKLEEAVQKTAYDLEVLDNLDILTAGPKPANPTELLESQSMKNLLAEARKKYDRIIIDTAPVLFVSDTAVLSATADGVIMVVRAEKRRGAHAARARKQIEKVKGRVIGGILNRVQVTRFGHYYSDYYYHGYARYYGDYYKSYYSRDEDEVSKQAGV